MELPFRIAAFAILALLILASGAAAGQSPPASADVTFTVPLNLTNLATDITRMRVQCHINSANLAIGGHRSGESSEIAVSAHQVVTTVNVVVLIPTSALIFSGPTRDATYSCRLWMFTPSFGWEDVTSGKALSPSYRFVPPLDRTVVGGTFQW